MAGLAALAACAPAVPGGQPATGGAAPAAAQVTLTFIVDTINEGHVKVRDKWAADFMAANPEVRIDHQTVPQEYVTKIQTLYAAGTPADIYRYLQEVTPIITVAEKNMHLQLDEFVAADDYDIDDFRPDAIALYTWEDKLYALPRDYGNQNIYYNIDLFEEAGAPLPTANWEDRDWNFETFLETATSLTKREGDRTTQWGFLVNRAQRPWASWLYCNGGALVHKDDRGVATETAMTDEASVEALQFVQDLMHVHKVAPTPDLESELGGFDLFASGRVAMMVNNPSAVNRYRTIEAFRWDVATLPIGKAERRGTGGGGTGWAAAAATGAPEWAWKFIAYISSAQAELDEVNAGATTPSRISVVLSEAFLDPDLPPANARGFADAQEYVVRDPVHVLWPEITQRIYNPKMDQLWSGALDAAAVAQEIAAEANPMFARSE
jgi:multiple sugar transport system substrate-binding protein